MAKTHHYELDVTWTGNTGTGTSGYREYDRAHDVTADGKPTILGSADPAFRGDPQRWNPEELLVVSLSQCHMLWVLALCSQEGIVVTGYTDHPSGTMTQTPDGGGHFTEVVLRPVVQIGVDVPFLQRLRVPGFDPAIIPRRTDRARPSLFAASTRRSASSRSSVSSSR